MVPGSPTAEQRRPLVSAPAYALASSEIRTEGKELDHPGSRARTGTPPGRAWGCRGGGGAGPRCLPEDPSRRLCLYAPRSGTPLNRLGKERPPAHGRSRLRSPDRLAMESGGRAEADTLSVPCLSSSAWGALKNAADSRTRSITRSDSTTRLLSRQRVHRIERSGSLGLRSGAR